MPDQPDLFSTPPRSHHGDPATSKAAELHLRYSGRLSRQQAEVYKLVLGHEGLAAFELTKVGGYGDPRTVPRRLSDLKEAGLVKELGTRTNPESGEECSRYYSSLDPDQAARHAELKWKPSRRQLVALAKAAWRIRPYVEGLHEVTRDTVAMRSLGAFLDRLREVFPKP